MTLQNVASTHTLTHKHASVKDEMCPHCEKLFSSKGSLSRHMKESCVFTENNYVCSKKLKKFFFIFTVCFVYTTGSYTTESTTMMKKSSAYRTAGDS